MQPLVNQQAVTFLALKRVIRQRVEDGESKKTASGSCGGTRLTGSLFWGAPEIVQRELLLGGGELFVHRADALGKLAQKRPQEGHSDGRIGIEKRIQFGA